MQADFKTIPEKFDRSTAPAAPLRVLDLFSGVGAYSLGLERTGGFRTVAFCEIEEYPRKILRKHWPDVPIFEDVRALNATVLRDAGIVPEWVVAGWPCQDISLAGTGSGLDGARSGLWGEIARLAGELDLDGLLLENSSNLLAINGGADFGRVLGDLASLGFDAEWHCLPAAAFDAPHIRDRLWIVAHRRGVAAHAAWGGQAGLAAACGATRERAWQGGEHPRAGSHADADESGRHGRARSERKAQGRGQPADARSHDANAGRFGCEGLCEGRNSHEADVALKGRSTVGAHSEGSRDASDAHSYAPIGTAIARRERHTWEPEPDVVRVVHGVANRAHRIAALGNLNPPIIPETIGRAILQARRAA
jgi:DNA (cytosine-5)-methyltransferase 1